MHRHGLTHAVDKPAAHRAWMAAAHDLAVQLRELREAKGWGIEEAAEAAGLHAKHLQRLERIQPQRSHEPNVTLKTLAALATVYDVTIPALFAASRKRR